MSRRETEAERLRRCRETFQRAHRDNLLMAEAAKRNALDRVAERERRIAELRASARSHAAPVGASDSRPGFWMDRD